MCKNLKSISFGEGLDEICEKAFLGCSSLTADISDLSCDIAENAFEECKNIINTEYSLESLTHYLKGKNIIEIGFRFNDEYYSFKNGFTIVKYNSDNKERQDIINKKGKVIGHSGEIVSDGLVMVKTDDNSGYVLKNTNGKILSHNIYSSFGGEHRFEKNGLLFVERNNKIGFIDKSGNEIVPCKYDYCIQSYSYDYEFIEGMASVDKGKKHGYIDDTGKEVIPCKYVLASPFKDGIAIVGKVENEDLVFIQIDKNGNFLKIDEEYETYENDGKYGYMKKNGEKITPCIYDNDLAFHTFHTSYGFFKDYAEVKRDGKYGFIDKTGNEFVSCVYDQVYDFKNGFAKVERDRKYGFVDKTGKQIVPCIYDGADDFKNGFAKVRRGKKYGFVDKTGKEIGPCIYGVADDFYNDYAEVMIQEGQWIKYGFIDKTGKEFGPFIYYDFGENIPNIFEVAVVQEEPGEKDKTKYGLKDETGKEITPCIYDRIASSIRDIQEGLIPATINGKSGFIDKSGKTIIPIIYDRVSSFSEGLAIVVKDGKFGFIDKSGKSTFDY